MRLTCFVISVFLLAENSCLRVRHYYMSPIGSDSNACTEAAPCLNFTSVDQRLGSSLRLGGGGTVIHAASGLYPNVILTLAKNGTAGARIRWQSDTKRGAKIHLMGCNGNAGGICSGPNQKAVHLLGSYIDFVGFDITNDGYIGILAKGTSATNLLIKDNQVYNIKCKNIGQPNVKEVGCAAIDIEPDDPSAGNNCLPSPPGSANDKIDANFVHDIATESAGGDGIPCGNCGHGIYAARPTVVITNNLVVAGTGQGITSFHYASNLTIQNNTVVNFENIGIVVSYSACNPGGNINTLVENNIVVGSGFGNQGFGLDVAARLTGNVERNNLFYDNHANCALGASPTSCASTDKLVNPLFVNNTGTQTGNYYLQAGSPAIDAGTAQGTAYNPKPPPWDFVGSKRPQGCCWDIGAYEYTFGALPR